MEKRIVRGLSERPLRVKMDALVHDLSEALKDSSCTSSVRVKAGFRRRTRSAGNIAILGNKATHSDDSISERLHSWGKEHGQSDSDEISANSLRRPVPYPLKKRPPHLNFEPSVIESDSVNENFSPLKTDRRKRKMKRMDCDPVVMAGPTVAPLGPPATSTAHLFPGPSATITNCPRGLSFIDPSSRVLSLPGPSGVRMVGKKKKPSKDVDRLDPSIGKRKRSNRERSVEIDVTTVPLGNQASLLLRAAHVEQMELDREIASSSSLSSSESDPGVQTNDEGREADDEQSDWFADARPEDEQDLETDHPAFQNIFHGSLDQMTAEARQAYSERIAWLRGGSGERERAIRGGRRRMHDDRTGFAVLTSANEKLSKFLQDCQQITLRLHHMEQEEREQLAQLVKMFSLHMQLEVTARGETCPVLSKTSSTPTSVRIDQTTLQGSQKKRRKLPHSGVNMVEMLWDAPVSIDPND